MIKKECNKNILLQKNHFLLGTDDTQTEIVIKYANKQFSFKAYNQKIHFSYDEFIQTIKVLSQTNSNIFRCYNEIQQSRTEEEEIYNISQALQYYQDIFIYKDNQIFLIDEYQRFQRLELKSKILKDKQKKLPIANFYKKKNIQIAKFKPLTIIKLEQDYCILYQSSNQYYLKFQQSKRITNKLKILPIVEQKFGKINKDNFNDIFSVQNEQLDYSDYIYNLCQNVQELKIDSKYISAINRIQRFVLRRQLKSKLSINQKQQKYKILWRKSLIWEDSAFFLLIALNQDTNNNQSILIEGKQIDHSLGREVYGLQQKLFLKYEMRDILITSNKMLQQVEIVHEGSNLRLKSEQFDQIYGRIFQYDNSEMEQTLNLRIAKSNSYRNQYVQNGFLNHLQLDNQQENKLDQKNIKSLFKLFYFQYRRHKLQNIVQYTPKDILSFPIHFLTESEMANLTQHDHDTDIQNVENEEHQIQYKSIEYKTTLNEWDFIHSIMFEEINFQNYLYKVRIYYSKEFFKELTLQIQSINLFHKYVISSISNMVFNKKLIEIVHNINSNLVSNSFVVNNDIMQEIVKNLMVFKIQRRVRFFQFIQRYHTRNSNFLLRISYIFSQNQYFKIIFRYKKKKIRILFNQQLFLLDLVKLANFYTLTKSQQSHYQISSFSQFLAIQNSTNQNDYRFKLSKLINFLENIIKIRHNSLYFSLKLPISQVKQQYLKSKSYTPNQAYHKKIITIQRFYRLILAQSFLNALKKAQQKQQNKLRHQCIRKIQGKYYIIYCYEISQVELLAKAVQYKEKCNCFQKCFKFKQSDFINYKQMNKYQFLANCIDLVDGEIQFILENYQVQQSSEVAQNDNEYQNLQDQSYHRQIRSRLINTKRDRNVLYNVVYSNQKILNSSCDSFLININLKSMRNVYHSEDKHTLIRNVAETSLDNIKYENNNLKVNISKIIPEKLKFSQKPRFQACQKILRQKAQVEVLHKTTQRFENQNKQDQQFQFRKITILGYFKQNLRSWPSI
ncbi:unnamed protein product (macronuclear) [Paramecium tetraurelia]|uniref:Uncharacterized protein n=1 Tax=Paramecium tetraurelia TaxID=5888 RepID=A0CEC3_PARTE|nr:uncharacterized protein GSPATT00037576001 [Paramecium tetraurelia]CAK69140.1 unnamed protein product [Paramecium tetraurelia]|eukprot:XP_001436537.1 hypothetical protein (macronuclear) [Paramecium tetraurelia strain d4-2]